MRSINLIVIHTSATRPRVSVDAAWIDREHRARGWSKIGYHYVIKRGGDVEVGRAIEEPGAHVQGYNAHSIGICLVGGLDSEGKPANNYTTQQWLSLASLVKMLKVKFPTAEVVGHRDLSKDKNKDGKIDPWEWVKVCPCFDVKTWWREVQ